MLSAHERRTALDAESRVAAGCTRCPKLVAARSQVVFGRGAAPADVLFVAEAPGPAEDAAGDPLAGRAGALLGELLAQAGIAPEAVYVTTAVKCLPPANRAPAPGELASCRPYLLRQVELVRPVVVCPLGSFATKLLRGEPAGVAEVRGRPEVRTIGTVAVRLLALFHPAAALYREESVALLRQDIAQIPGLVALGHPPQPTAEPEPEEPQPPPGAPPPPGQLGLF